VSESRPVILLVGDSEDDVTLTLHAVCRSNVASEIVVARDGAEALDFLPGTAGGPLPPLPALVLLDLELPQVDRLEVLRRIRAAERTCLLLNQRPLGMDGAG
jgi:two-component system response regulator